MIESNIIKKILENKEGEQLEFKTTVQLESVARTVCAFLNTKGGQLILGADETSIVGIEDSINQTSILTDYLTTMISPESIISVRNEIVDNKSLILVETLEGSKKPYVFNGSIFVRRNKQTTIASSEELSELIQDRKNTEIHWERLFVLGLEEEDLDAETIDATIKTINKSRGVDIGTAMDFFSKYGLFINGNYTNAALVLFGNEPSIYLPQCRIRVTIFNTDKTGSTFDYDRILEGHLFKNINEIIQFFETSIGLFSEFNEQSWQRTDKPRYPILALREGVLNAIIHRDYSNVSGSVFIGIYPNKIEITNYGELPKGLTTADLKKNHLSIPRNPDIAHIFYLTQWIEKLGRGTLKIIEECKKNGLKEPKWISDSGVTTLTFFGHQAKEKEITTEKLNERQMRLLQHLEAGANITATEYHELIGGQITERSTRKDLLVLVRGGWLTKQGRGKNTLYVRTSK